MSLPTKIPEDFQKYFWDTNAKALNPTEKPLFVIQRLLDWNDFSAAKWVINNFPTDSIRQSLINLRGWSKESASFWSLYFGIPRKEVMCNHQGFPNPPVMHWNN